MKSVYTKIGILIGAITLSTLLQSVSCNREPIHVKWAHSEFTAREINHDTLGSFYMDPITNYDTVEIAQTNLGFNLTLMGEEIVDNYPTPSFIEPAYAFSFTRDYILENRVDSIQIISLRDYNANYLANSNITDIMMVYYDDKFVDFKTVIKESPDLNYSMKNDRGLPPFEFYMKLKEQATLDTVVQFESRVYFSNRKTSIDTSQIVLLKK